KSPSSKLHNRASLTECRYPLDRLRGRYRIRVCTLQEHLSKSEPRAPLRLAAIHHPTAIPLRHERLNDVPVRVLAYSPAAGHVVHEPQIKLCISLLVASPRQPRRHVQILGHLRILVPKPLLVLQQRGELVPTARCHRELGHAVSLAHCGVSGPGPSVALKGDTPPITDLLIIARHRPLLATLGGP